MNNVVLVGRLTKDLELQKTMSGTSVVKFTLAVNRKYKNDGESTADFIRCIAWNKTAEIMTQYLSKGSQIGIVGRITTGSYRDSYGNAIYTTDVTVESFEFLESKKKEDDYSQYQQEQTLPWETEETY